MYHLVIRREKNPALCMSFHWWGKLMRFQAEGKTKLFFWKRTYLTFQQSDQEHCVLFPWLPLNRNIPQPYEYHFRCWRKLVRFQSSGKPFWIFFWKQSSLVSISRIWSGKVVVCSYGFLKGNQNPHIKFTFIIKYSLLRTTSESLNKIRQRIRKLQLFEI